LRNTNHFITGHSITVCLKSGIVITASYNGHKDLFIQNQGIGVGLIGRSVNSINTIRITPGTIVGGKIGSCIFYSVILRMAGRNATDHYFIGSQKLCPTINVVNISVIRIFRYQIISNAQIMLHLSVYIGLIIVVFGINQSCLRSRINTIAHIISPCLL